MKTQRLVVVTILLAGLLAPGPLAATSPLNEVFAAFKQYTDGGSRRAVIAVERAVYQASGDPKAKAAMAARLIALLEDKSATAASKCLTCKYLPLVGDDRAVKALVPLLADPRTAGPARGALQRLPGPGAAQALRDALKGATGPARIGLINSLGARRDAKATGTLVALLTDEDPGVADAAAAALGAIGATEAATALTDKILKPTPALLDALLVGAGRRRAAGDAKSAAAVYRRLTAKGQPDNWRWAGLTGLAKCSPDEALPQLLEALDDKSGKPAGPALSLIAAMPGEKVTAALTARLDRLDSTGRVLLLGTLEQRCDPSAAAAVAKYLGSDDQQVQLAAVRAIGWIGDEKNIAALARIAASGQGAAAAARESLVRLPGDKVDAALLAGLSRGKPAIRVELLTAAVARRADGIVLKLLSAARDSAPPVRAAACRGLAQLAGQAEYPKLVRMLAAATTDSDRQGLEQALSAAGRRIKDRSVSAKAVLAALKSSKGVKSAALLRVLSNLGGAEALGALVDRLSAGEAPVREAALRCLADWRDPAACAPLLKVIRDTSDARHRILAMRGYLRLAPASKDPAAAFTKILALVKTAENKRRLLSALAGAPASTDTLTMAVSMLDDSQVRREAAYAVVAIAQQLARRSPAAVLAAVGKVRQTKPGKDIIAKIAAIERQAGRGRGSAPVRPNYGQKEIEARKKQLTARGPKGSRLAAYLDCGMATATGGGSPPQIRQMNGRSWAWPGARAAGGGPAATVAFDDSQVPFAVSGLDAKKQYVLGFSWWDYDHNDRVQSVWASPAGGKATRLLNGTKLPSYIAGGKKPAELSLAIPQTLSSKGQVRVMFRREGGTNAVVGEVWLWETGGAKATRGAPASKAAPGPAAARKPPGAPAKPQAAAPAKLHAVMPAPKDAGRTSVLIVTGVDHPGHKWRQTAPLLADILAKDKRLEVRIVKDPHQLASPTLHKYDVVVLHFMDWKVPSPGPEARGNFKKFVEAGGGLVLVHFACGAWQDWPVFVKIAGRAWNPKLRGHDRYGKFIVRISDAAHEITRGMKDFETTDELYTCLDGKAEIRVLADATSKVDKKVYPMAFVRSFGKGRVFHSLLGHDVRAFKAEGVRELYRRGTAWAAGLPAVAPKE